MPSYRDLEIDVIRWSEARKIIPNSTPLAQARKTGEEAVELIEAAAKLQAIDEADRAVGVAGLDGYVVKLRNQYVAELKDAVGDVVVTLINVCALADIDLVQCLEGAYAQIKDRRGTLMPNGIFVKEL